MPSIPIWGVVILITSVVFITGCLLFSLLRCRHFARSTIDPAEFSDKKHGGCTFDTKSTSTASLSTPPSNSQSYIPSTTRSSSNHIDHIQIQLPSPSPDTSLLVDEMELGSADASRTVSLSRSNHTSKSDTPNRHDFEPTDWSGTNIISQKVPSTIKSTVHHPMSRQKPHAKKINAHQLFDLSNSQPFNDNVSDVDSAKSLPPPPLPPKSMLSVLPPPTSLPSKKENGSRDQSPNYQDKPKIAPPSTFSHRPNDEANQDNSSTRISLSSPGINGDDTIGIGPESRQLLAHNLHSMFAWSTSDDDVDDGSDHDSIASILHQNDNNADIRSVTSGSVHRLVRDSTVLDADHRSIAARSIVSSVRPSLHDMASWWPIQDNAMDHTPDPSEQARSTEVDTLDAIRPLSPVGICVQDSLHLLSQSDVPIGESTNSCRPSSSKTIIYSSTPASTYSRVTLDSFRLALINGDQDQEPEQEPESELEPTEQKPSAACQPPPTGMQYTSVPDNELSPPSPASPHNNEEFESTIHTKSISATSTISNQTTSKVASEREIKSLPARPKALPSIRASPRNSTTIGASGGSKMDSIRRELQDTWNTHRLSDQASMASGSTLSSMSPAMSPPGSVNPRQLNQHLVSMSLKGAGRSQQHRPGLPNGFMNEEWLVQDATMEEDGPQPTVSFSSSTVRTMIPENEPIVESHVGKKKTLVFNQQKTQPQPQIQKTTATPQRKQQPKKETTSIVTGLDSAKDQDQEQESSFVETMRANRQQRGSIPWSSNAFTKSNTDSKTPAQRERDRYLQSLNE